MKRRLVPGAVHPAYLHWQDLLTALDRLAHNLRAAGYRSEAEQVTILRESIYETGPRRSA
jgi:hypothetical protein